VGEGRPKEIRNQLLRSKWKDMNFKDKTGQRNFRRESAMEKYWMVHS
jgi:hypothetical protein